MKVEDLLKNLRKSKKKIYFLKNPGNRGDGLIYLSTKKAFSRYKTKYKEIKFPEKINGEILIVSGGGAFSHAFHHMIGFLNFYIPCFDEIYILPQSFDVSCYAVRKFLKKLPKKVKIFCREKYSFKNVKKTVKYKENVFLDHDMAFHLNYKKWKKKGIGKLYSFRRDLEKSFLKIEKNDTNWDISEGTELQGISFIKDIVEFEEVHSNRTHVAIAAAMLGKKTFVYPSNYFKQKAIYEFSLSHLSNVTWVNCEESRLLKSLFSYYVFIINIKYSIEDMLKKLGLKKSNKR